MMKRIAIGLLLVLGLACALPAQNGETSNLQPLLAILQQIEEPDRQQDILQGISEGLRGRRSVPMPESWPELEKELLTSPNQEVRSLAQSLGLLFGSEQALAALKRSARDPSAPRDERQSALEALLNKQPPDLPELLFELLDQPALRETALQGLAQYEHPETPERIAKVYPQLAADEKRAALNTLASRVAFAEALLDLIESQTIPAEHLTADLTRQLQNLNSDAIDRGLKRIQSDRAEVPEDGAQPIRHYRQVFSERRSETNPSHGRALFAQACQQCHQLFGIGGQIGPDLTGSNRTDLQYLLENVVAPNALIPEEYQTSTIETTDGRVLTGIIQGQNDRAVTIQMVGQSVTIPRDEIDSIEQQETSMMPAGLLAAFSNSDVADLIAYMQQETQVPVEATPLTVDLFFNGQDLTNWQGNPDLWSVEDGAIVGHTEEGLGHNEFLNSLMILDDFRLICQVKLDPNTENSGIQFRSRPLPDGEVKGYQADIGQGWWGKLYEERGRGLLWDKSATSHVREGEWNTYEIVAHGDRILTALNGNRCVDLTDPEGDKRGVISLQLHSGGPMTVSFKDFQLELDPEPKLKTVQE